MPRTPPRPQVITSKPNHRPRQSCPNPPLPSSTSSTPRRPSASQPLGAAPNNCTSQLMWGRICSARSFGSAPQEHSKLRRPCCSRPIPLAVAESAAAIRGMAVMPSLPNGALATLRAGGHPSKWIASEWPAVHLVAESGGLNGRFPQSAGQSAMTK